MAISVGTDLFTLHMTSLQNLKVIRIFLFSAPEKKYSYAYISKQQESECLSTHPQIQFSPASEI